MNIRDTREIFIAANDFDENAAHLLRKTLAILNILVLVSLMGLIPCMVVYLTRLAGFWGLVVSSFFAVFSSVSVLAFAQRSKTGD